MYRPAPWYQVATGFSIDSPVRGDVPFGGRVLNYSWYLNRRFPLGSGLTIGSDYQLWTTEWQGFRQGRVSLIKFFLAQAF